MKSQSLSMSKGSVLEDTVVPEEAGSPKDKAFGDFTYWGDTLSNESITKGMPFIDTYDVISDTIKGGMGSVWKVHHNSWNTDLAVNVPIVKKLIEILVGSYYYYGITDNSRSIHAFSYEVTKSRFYWWERRGQRRSYTWKGFLDMIRMYQLSKVKIYVSIYV